MLTEKEVARWAELKDELKEKRAEFDALDDLLKDGLTNGRACQIGEFVLLKNVQIVKKPISGKAWEEFAIENIGVKDVKAWKELQTATTERTELQVNRVVDTDKIKETEI